jgi:hypothetical protein
MLKGTQPVLIPSPDFRFIHQGSALARAAKSARRFGWIIGNDHMVIMDFDQRPYEWKAFEASVDTVAHGIANLETGRIKVEVKRTAFTHILHLILSSNR